MIKCDTCGGTEEFFQYVVDMVSVDPGTGETAFGDCCDNDMLKEEFQGVFCAAYVKAEGGGHSQCDGKGVEEDDEPTPEA